MNIHGIDGRSQHKIITFIKMYIINWDAFVRPNPKSLVSVFFYNFVRHHEVEGQQMAINQSKNLAVLFRIGNIRRCSTYLSRIDSIILYPERPGQYLDIPGQSLNKIYKAAYIYIYIYIAP